MSSTGSSSVPRIQVFRPTMEEFKDFSKYITHIESTGAHKAGLAKIIPPEGWTPRKKGYDDIELVIPAPISQVVTGSQGLYQQLNIQQKGMTVKEFKKMAESNKYKTPSHFDYEDLERKYWKNITYNSPIYGADVSGSLYDDGVEEFNIQNLKTILDMVMEGYEIKIEGVNTAYLYFGMWKTSFAWHTEDMDLYSINYLHFGAPKSWYVVPPEHGRRLERLAAGFFHGSHQSCQAFLRHKMTIISPAILKKYSIPYQKITQEPGEFMITFPFGYHSGFNHGFNCAESTNFALPRWIEYGKRSTHCTCRNDCVKICMDMFVRKFQPDIYELWKAGKDFGSHPEDPSRHCAAPAPKKLELALSAQREERKRVKETQKIKRHPISKLEKRDCKKGSKVHPRESDEETELYDLNEAIGCKSPKKQLKKKRRDMKSKGARETKVERNESDQEMKEESENEDEMKDQSKVESVEGEMEVSQNGQASDEMKNQNGQSNQFEEVADIGVASKVKEEDIETEEIQDWGYRIENESKISNSEILKDEGIKSEEDEMASHMEHPPELKPFWAPEVKTKICNATITQDKGQTFDNHLELLNKYPHLKQAISSGTFSVIPVTSSPEEDAHRSHTVESMQVDKKLSGTKPQIFQPGSFSSPNTMFSQTWRCEQTNNGLKIKIVQPKRIQENKEETPDVSNSVASLVTPSTSSSEDEFVEDVKEDGDQKLKQRKTLSPQTKGKSRKPTKAGKNGQQSDSSPNGSTLPVERADNSQDSWAHPLKNLWQHQPKNFEAEIEFNQKLASIDPHCAICIIFTPMYTKTHFPTEPTSVPSCSQVRMPTYCYGNSLNSECMLDTNSLLRSDGTAPLLICSVCKICVHATCYGISMLPMGSWVCTRCTRQAQDAECCLCVLRGGALKPTADDRWAHVVCAILIEETYFENTLQKQPVNMSKITPKRQRLKCKFCVKTTLPKESKGVCVQCRSGKCYLPYHVTCGYMAGVIFETSDWPEPIHMICTRHAAARRKPPKREMTNVAVGERVIAKHRNKRFYWANVKKKVIQEYYSILFDDNSHSTNTLPEDIVSRNVAIHGPPNLNEKVQVKWTDEKVYNGFFKGSQSLELYVVEFDDGSLMHQERKQIYAADEELPKEVQSKMSHSSERQSVDFLTEAEGKRIRVTNQKYS